MIWGVVAMVFLGAVIVTRVLGLKRISAQWAIEEGDTARARALTLAGRLVVAGSVIAVLGGLLNVGAIVGVGFALIALSITPPLYYVGRKHRSRQG
jgi:low temperature requirement protein LtrA